MNPPQQVMSSIKSRFREICETTTDLSAMVVATESPKGIYILIQLLIPSQALVPLFCKCTQATPLFFRELPQ
ncbi:MAG: hypothetical protein RLZZ347_700 [Candidatus Parcubacteria bacterium]|jgi:hypothetical protein